MVRNWLSFFRDASIRNKMLIIILPLIILPMLILAVVGFITSSHEAAKTSIRYLKASRSRLSIACGLWRVCRVKKNCRRLGQRIRRSRARPGSCDV